MLDLIQSIQKRKETTRSGRPVYKVYQLTINDKYYIIKLKDDYNVYEVERLFGRLGFTELIRYVSSAKVECLGTCRDVTYDQVTHPKVAYTSVTPTRVNRDLKYLPQVSTPTGVLRYDHAVSQYGTVTIREMLRSGQFKYVANRQTITPKQCATLYQWGVMFRGVVFASPMNLYMLAPTRIHRDIEREMVLKENIQPSDVQYEYVSRTYAKHWHNGYKGSPLPYTAIGKLFPYDHDHQHSPITYHSDRVVIDDTVLGFTLPRLTTGQ